MFNILRPLIKSNVAILSQKIALLDLLVARRGAEQASIGRSLLSLCSDTALYNSDVRETDFQTVCPIVGASVGQHYRHSMDHVELAVLVASSVKSGESFTSAELHYDLRVRGGTLEKDISQSRKRIADVVEIFHSLHSVDQEEDPALTSSPVTSYFNLSDDSNAEMGLYSTIGRELGFAAHHAIHHMMMVKIIATNTLGVEEDEIPHGFGKAPSTIVFHKQQQD